MTNDNIIIRTIKAISLKGSWRGMLCMMVIMLVASCSMKKNTPATRAWQSFVTRYNVYYNGSLAYIDASLEKEKGNKDNYTEQLPLYTVSNKASREIGKGNYDKAIEKAQKAIKLHSINAKPQWTKNRPKNAKEIEYFSRKEYNPFLWKAWMLMGRSQFHKGAFDDAAATFSWMSRMYKTQPAIYGKARAWLAKCYLEQDWVYDAEDVIRNMQRDSIDWRAQKEWDYTLADYYLHTGELDKASEYLRKVVKHEMRSKQRAREYYILGQIEAAQGNRDAAYRAFKKVISQNPPYELEFNARIAMTEVLAKGQAKQMIRRLKRMARNDNNKDYLDQVYYAMGNIYLAQLDTLSAIGAYEKGNEKGTRTGIEKGVLLLHLGDLYWQLEKYSDAQRCYGSAIGMLDKERKDYKQLSDRSKVLDELVPFTDAIHLQDSLQLLAKMDEKERNAAIDRVIEALKKKEKEERDKLAEAEAQKVVQKNGQQGNRNTPIASQGPAAGNRNQTFYFYNPTAVQQGKQAFERQWGRRDNADDWQRMNKTVVSGLFSDGDDDGNSDTASADSTANATLDSIATSASDSGKDKAAADSAANDPHKREYYLAQIPFTEEQVMASNEIIKDGLFRSGIIFKDKLDNLPLSEKQFTRLIGQFPEFETMDEVYYHLFLLYSRLGDKDKADSYVGLLSESYPESKWTIVVTDPYFEENARFGKHIEDSLYTATYDAFLNNRFDEVMANTELSDTRFILGDNRDKFLFISGLSYLNMGQPDSCLTRMEKVVKDFPKSSVQPIAGMIINGVKEGRTLRDANFSMTDIWDRRTAVMAESDSIAGRKLSDERETPFTFMFVFAPDSVDENQLLYQMARFNFTTFVARNFDLDIEVHDGLHRMQVSGFRNFDEARQYMRVLYDINDALPELTRKSRAIVISNENLPLLGTQYSYNDYDSFYVEHFQPLPAERIHMLYEPDEFKESKIQKAEREEMTPALPSEQAAPGGVAPVKAPTDNDDDADDDDALINIGDDDNASTGNTGTFDIPDSDNGVKPAEETFIINDTPTQSNAASDDTFIIEEDKKEAGSATSDDTFIIEEDKKEGSATSDDTFIIEEDKKEAGSATSDDTFIIEEETAPSNSATEDTFIIEDDKKSIEEVEDEYYELDGF